MKTNQPRHYHVVTAFTSLELSCEVSLLLEEGWNPLGSPFVHGELFCQALIHDTHEND